MKITVLIAAIVGAFVGVVATAQSGPFPEVPGWQDYAAKYLTTLDGKPFDEGTRCVKLNNYPCIKQKTASAPWLGTGANGARDFAGHAMFEHPKWSIVADFQWFYTRTSGGKSPRSALELAEIYSPWCDTLGSVPSKKDDSGVEWGRGCGGREGPPPGFKGPMCKAPAAGQSPAPGQCQACNCPSSAAAYWIKGSGSGIDDKLTLFDEKGRPTPALQNMVSRVVGLESGKYRPNAVLMTEAADAFEPQPK